MAAPIHVCLWFDDQAEAAASYYCNIFTDSRLGAISHYSTGEEIHGKPVGSVMTVEFELNGMHFTGLNGGPHFRFNEAISLQVMCDSQEEVDHYWSALGAGGPPEAQQCGWVKDRYGVSWQIIPKALTEMLLHPDVTRTARVMQAMLQMRKLDLGALQQAFQAP
jgi:predicted 3-demethylubiquinone-9 3-methyltransferase (glyoxalase superfamily)